MRSTAASLWAAAREWASNGLSDDLRAIASAPVWSAAQIASRQPPKPSRAALRESIRAAASRVRAARFAPIAKQGATTGAGRGGPRLRAPILAIKSGPLEGVLAVSEALEREGWAPHSLHDWLSAMRRGIAGRGRAHVLTIDSDLAPADDAGWSALATRRALVFVPLDINGQSRAWSTARLRELAAQGIAFGWTVPRDAPDWETSGALAKACADAAAALNDIGQPGPPIASLAAGGGARFLVERLRDAGFAGALGQLTGQAHLDDPAFDLRRISLDARQPTARLVQIVTAQ
jgi:hypothetical protein